MLRRRIIRLTSDPDPELARDIAARLLAGAGIESAVWSGGRLQVTYEFPAASLCAVLTAIADCRGRIAQPWWDRWRLQALAGMEANELERLDTASGWDRYIGDIFMRYFPAGRLENIDARKQTWRKYK